MKLEAWLRLAELPYEVHNVQNPSRGPKGKVPFITDGDVEMGDSSLIIEYLKQQYGVDPDAALTAEQRALATAYQRLMEDHLYFTLMYSVWADETFWPGSRQAIFGGIPWPLRPLLAGVVQRDLRKVLHAQGTARHSRAEIYAQAAIDIHALSTQLGTKPFFLGDTAHTIDAVAYGFLATILQRPTPTPVKQATQQHDNLVAYFERLQTRFFADA